MDWDCFNLVLCYVMLPFFKQNIGLTLGPSKLEKVADPVSGPRGPLPKIRVHYLQGQPLGFDTKYLALADRNMQVRFSLKVVWES